MMRTSGILLGFLVCSTILAIVPVHADLATPAITHVYFEKDGAPHNESVHYTVSCYMERTRDTGGSNRTAPEIQYDKVFSYSASCPGYGCTVYEPYYRVDFMKLDQCDLAGETGGKKFTLSNFSTLPYSRCTWLPERYHWLLDYPETGTNYYETGEYTVCNALHRNVSVSVSHQVFISCNLTEDPGCFSEMLPEGIPLKKVIEFWTTRNGTELDLDHTIRYLESCDPLTDPDCPGVVIDNRPLKTRYELRPFRNVSFSLNNPCDTFLVRANRSLYLTKEQSYALDHAPIDNHVRKICESRWTIPPDTPAVVPTTGSYAYLPRSPVESLYCGILSIFGARC